MRTISVKVSILYTFLAFINIAFFTIIIFENQSELLTENNKLLAKELATNIYSDIEAAMNTAKDVALPDETTKYYEKLVNEIKSIARQYKTSISNFLVFNDERSLIYQDSPDFPLQDHHLHDARRSITNKDFLGQLFFIKIDENDYEILLYIPLKQDKITDIYILFNLRMKNISKRLSNLYRMIMIIIVIITVFHIIFGFLLHRIIISPIKVLHRKSTEISDGNLSARVKLKSKDEIGQLGRAFNLMANSVQEKILLLDNQNKKMLDELKMAGKVQKAIYPKLRHTEGFNVAVYHSPFTEVSGDYHDFFPLGENRYGILIADVCGHGVPAALITMRVKEAFRNAASNYSDTKDLLMYINGELSDLMTDFDSYFTAFYIIVDEKNDELIYSNAGHSKVFLYKEEDKNIHVLDTKGAMIGVSEEVNFTFVSKKTTLSGGDKIILFTDGILEARNVQADQYDYDKLMVAIEKFKQLPYNKMLELIIGDLKEFVGKAKQFDDETMIIIEMK